MDTFKNVVWTALERYHSIWKRALPASSFWFSYVSTINVWIWGQLSRNEEGVYTYYAGQNRIESESEYRSSSLGFSYVSRNNGVLVMYKQSTI